MVTSDFLQIQKIDVSNNYEFEKKYSKKNGVWIVVGTKKKSKEKHVLNVAVTIDIYKEIKEDIEFSKEKKYWEKNKTYINQFGEEIFKYPDNGYARKFVYSDIYKKYENIKYFCIASGDKKELNSSAKKEIEKIVAYYTKAKYWRNGGAFVKKPSDKVKKAIENKVDKFLFDKNEYNNFLENLKKCLTSKN